MFVLDSDNVVMVDCDETLVLWDYPNEQVPNTVLFDNCGYDTYLLPHTEHIKLLRQFKARGHKIVVWSQGGYEWAKTVVETLGIEDLVDIVMCKPKWYIDDLDCKEFMGMRYYTLLDFQKKEKA